MTTYIGGILSIFLNNVVAFGFFVATVITIYNFGEYNLSNSWIFYDYKELGDIEFTDEIK